MADQSEAAKRAAARRAKIQARGNAGLQKLAQTARGEEAQALYGDDSVTSSPRPSTPSNPPTSTSSKGDHEKPSWAPPASSARNPPTGMTDEQRQMQEQLAAMFGSLGGGPGVPGAEGGMPDFQKMMAQMMGMEAPPQNLLGDLDDPAGLGGTPNPLGGNMFGQGGMPDLSSMLGSGGMPGMGMGMGMGGPRGKTKVDKWFPVVHFASIVVLALFSVVWWEPTLRSTRGGVLGGVGGTLSRWAGLAGGRGVVRVIKQEVLGGIEVLPIFWAFTTLELLLQTTRFMVLKSPPPPHSLISNFLPLMPPAISRPVLTGSRYLSLLSQAYKDGALLVFVIGLTISLAPYLSSARA